MTLKRRTRRGPVLRVALPALRHRVILNFQGEAESRDIDVLVNQIVESIPNAASV